METAVYEVKPINVEVIKQEEQSASALVREAESLSVKTAAEFKAAGEIRAQLKARIKRADDLRKQLTQPLDFVKKNIMGLFAPLQENLEKAVAGLDRKVIAYTEEVDRLAREAQAKAEEDARKERERLEAKAKKAEAQGKTETAQLYQEQAEMVITPAVTPSTPKVAGQGIKETWYAEVVDMSKLPNKYKLPDMVTLNKMAQASHGKVSVPGVVFRSKKSVVGRSAVGV